MRYEKFAQPSTPSHSNFTVSMQNIVNLANPGGKVFFYNMHIKRSRAFNTVFIIAIYLHQMLCVVVGCSAVATRLAFKTDCMFEGVFFCSVDVFHFVGVIGCLL